MYGLLPISIQRKLLFYKDLFISLASLAIGRLLPELRPAPVDLSDKTAIITGANSGIGLQIACDLAKQHCTVYLACRNAERAQKAINHVLWRSPYSKGKVHALSLDTSDLENVRNFAVSWSHREESERQIDILVHNAGIAEVPASASDLTSDGLDLIYTTNFLGSFLLTHFLEPFLAPSARIILTSSTGQYAGRFSRSFSLGPVRGVVEPGFHCPIGTIPILTKWFGIVREQSTSSGRYANTKSMQCAFARLLQGRFDYIAAVKGNSPHRVVHAFTPGFTSTPIFAKFDASKNTGLASWFANPLYRILQAALKLAVDVDQGAATGTWLVTTDDETVVGVGHGGGYWDRMERRISSANLMSREMLDRLWVRWERDAGIDWR